MAEKIKERKASEIPVRVVATHEHLLRCMSLNNFLKKEGGSPLMQVA